MSNLRCNAMFPGQQLYLPCVLDHGHEGSHEAATAACRVRWESPSAPSSRQAESQEVSVCPFCKGRLLTVFTRYDFTRDERTEHAEFRCVDCGAHLKGSSPRRRCLDSLFSPGAPDAYQELVDAGLLTPARVSVATPASYDPEPFETEE